METAYCPSPLRCASSRTLMTQVFHTSPTPPNPQIMPHRGDWNGHPQLLLTSGNVVLHTYHTAVVQQHVRKNGQKAAHCFFVGWLLTLQGTDGQMWGLLPVSGKDLTCYTYLVVQHLRQLVTPDSSSASGHHYNTVAFVSLGTYI